MQNNKRYLSTRIIAIALLFILIAVILAVIAFGVGYRHNYADIVKYCTQKYSVDYNLINAIMRQESRFNAKAKSSKGATGLMQLMPTTAMWLAEKFDYGSYDLYLPKDNISLACIYIDYLTKKYNDIDLVVIAYNAGEGRVDSWLQLTGGELKGNIPFSETKTYHRKVMNNLMVYNFIG